MIDASPLYRGLGSGEGPPSSQLFKETLIVFDWDDTILPTTWLQRLHNSSGGFLLNSETEVAMKSLSAICAETLLLASSLGQVIFVTNSVPGWMDQSCQMFMPQLLELIRRYNIIARPMHAALTFKTGVFQREFKSYRNLISIGDGNAERSASLRLQMTPDLMLSGRDSKEGTKRVKSVKLLELPTCQQLYAQHEMLHQRLADIVSFRGHLDVKSRLPSNHGLSQVLNMNREKVPSCTLVHFARPFGATQGAGGGAPWSPASTQGGGPWPIPAEDSKISGVLSLRTIAPGPSSPLAERPERGVFGCPALGAARKAGGQLPALGPSSGGSNGKTTPDLTPQNSAPSLLDRLQLEDRAEQRLAGGAGSLEPDGGTAASETLLQAMGGSSAADAVDGNETQPMRPASCAEDRFDKEKRELKSGGKRRSGSICKENSEALGGTAGRRSTSTPGGVGSCKNKQEAPEGVWKVHSMERGSPGSRSPYTGLGKKRPVLPTGLGARSTGAVWREQSAPASTRNF